MNQNNGGWGKSQPLTNNLSAAAETVTVLLAGPKPKTDIWQGVLGSDTRFRVTTLAATSQDLEVKVATNPDLLLIDASIYAEPDPLIKLLTRVHACAYIILPAIDDPEVAQKLEKIFLDIEVVKGVYYIDVTLQTLIEKMYGDVRARRAIALGELQSTWVSTVGGNGNGYHASPVSTRIITVWNQMGGVGKTTISGNLAAAAAQRGYPTVLIGLGAPDDLPLIMGLKKQPNITNWQANPTLAGMKTAVQKMGTLDVIGGFPDVLSEGRMLNLSDDDPKSVKALVDIAIRAGYATIVIDAPPTAMAASAMTSSNTLVIVGRPSLEGVYRTVEAYRTVVERLAGMHNIPTNQIYVALNRGEPGFDLDAQTWHAEASAELKRAFPPIIAEIPDLPEIRVLQNRRLLPFDQSVDFQRAITPLADVLFAENGHPAPIPAGKIFKLGPIKIKV